MHAADKRGGIMNVGGQRQPSARPLVPEAATLLFLLISGPASWAELPVTPIFPFPAVQIPELEAIVAADFNRDGFAALQIGSQRLLDLDHIELEVVP
jgi:hypothetical protein